MIAVIQEAFPEIDNCLSIVADKHSYIYEDSELKKGLFVSKTDEKHLHIENHSNHPFYFLQNDECVMKTEKGGQCDYVVFNNSKFYFIEVKTASKNILNRKTKVRAYDQIENTYKFYSKKIDFSNELFLIGMICVSNSKRIVQTSKSTKRKEFKIKYKIDLQEGNYILFE